MAPERFDEPSQDQLEEQADAAADFLEELLSRMDIDAIAEPAPQGGHMYVDIVDGLDEDMSLLIGHNGQTLEAIQELTRMVVGRRLGQRVRVIVDVDDYKKRREARLAEHAKEIAERVLQAGDQEELEPMNSYERKLVHDAVSSIEGIETESRGLDPDRYVVIRRS
jgi:spoIIIJ-associated protein